MSYAQQILNSSKYSSLNDMAEAWLGDWTMAHLTDEQAFVLAAECEEKQQAGDDRDYCEIVKEMMADFEASNKFTVTARETVSGRVVEKRFAETQEQANEFEEAMGQRWSGVEVTVRESID